MEAMLAPVFRFHPEVDIDVGDVGVYLHELDVHGVGGTLDEALDDLAEAMLEVRRRLGRSPAPRAQPLTAGRLRAPHRDRRRHGARRRDAQRRR